MHLYFLRHGKAEQPWEWTGTEADRPLTEHGRATMRAAAGGMRTLDLQLSGIFSSPLARSRQSADIVGEALEVPVFETAGLAPGCDLDEISAIIGQQRATQSLMFVGHEPDLSTIVGMLIGWHGPANITMKKGACCRVDISPENSSAPILAGRGALVWLLTCKQLGRLQS